MNSTRTLVTVVLLSFALSTWANASVEPANTATGNKAGRERTVLVVVGHGSPASDFPREKLLTLTRLVRQIEAAGGEESAPADLVKQLHELERESRTYPRNDRNDPYDAAVKRIAQHIAKQNRFHRVLVAHNEFCGLDVHEAIDEAVKLGATRVLVATVMVTPGGRHSERDIPEKIARAQKNHPQVKIQYIWPVSEPALANFLLREIDRHSKSLTTTR